MENRAQRQTAAEAHVRVQSLAHHGGRRNELELHLLLCISPPKSLEAGSPVGLVKSMPSPRPWEGRTLHGDRHHHQSHRTVTGVIPTTGSPKPPSLRNAHQLPESNSENADVYNVLSMEWNIMNGIGLLIPD